MHGPETDPLPEATPADVGLDADAVEDAVDYAKTHDTPREQVRYDFAGVDQWDETETEYGGRLGPMPDRRGGPSGMVLREGSVVAEWGDVDRVDHAFSVAKSFLSLCAGVAYDRGLIADLDDRVGDDVDDDRFEGPHNGRITWRHLLTQTSEWEGTLFGKPDEIDRNRAVGKDADLDKGESRDLREPGDFWEYNDVRINVLAVALLELFGKPLPRVLAHEVGEPVGGSRRWEWHGYHNSDVTVDGRRLRSVSGGGHWGGGLWIPTRDLARFGQLLLQDGRWDGEQVLSTEYLDAATTPCGQNDSYGFLFWLNEGGTLWPDAPESSFAALGHGQNALWVDPEHELVAAVRWLRLAEDRDEVDHQPNLNALLGRLVDAVEG
jgi:CubicO group peptidase (beta-lactamase class C family)